MIRIGERPESDPADAFGMKLNKFIGPDGTGHRGLILAINDRQSCAVVLCMTGSTEHGKRYLIRERSPDEYPVVVREIAGIPCGGNWIVVPAAALVSPAMTVAATTTVSDGGL